MVLWTPECQQSFLKRRSLLTLSPILRAPDYSLPFIVQTDARDIGLGVVLSQLVDGIEHLVCFLSSMLLPRERNYSTIEECLAIALGCPDARFLLV